MSDAFFVAPAGMAAFADAAEAASEVITAVGSADSAAMLAAAAGALGPIGATYLTAFSPSQANNLAGTLLVGGVHAGVSSATDASKSAVVAADNG